MEEITLLTTWHGSCTVIDGRAKLSRLVWQAPGLNVYVRGPLGRFTDLFGNVAINHAIARHIPAISVRRVGR